MKNIYFLLLIIASSTFGFVSLDDGQHFHNWKNVETMADSLSTSDFNEQWRQKINSGAEDLGQLYTKDAVKVMPNGTILEGRETISEHYKVNPQQVESISSLKNIIAVLDSTILYEIGSFSTSGKKEFAQLVLWRKAHGKLFRELELITPTENTKDLKPEIDKIRNDWMAVCNAHNTKKLVTEFYSENALYYNHRPMIIGHEAIIEEYGYMNNPNYELTLNPIIFEPVNGSMVFEIGQCSGSYNGNYVLVWQKNDSGEWRIFFDSNI